MKNLKLVKALEKTILLTFYIFKALSILKKMAQNVTEAWKFNRKGMNVWETSQVDTLSFFMFSSLSLLFVPSAIEKSVKVNLSGVSLRHIRRMKRREWSKRRVMWKPTWGQNVFTGD